MSKRIVLFSDGTGNSAARLQKTNVWRLYQALERMPGQIAYYDDGVGTSSWRPLAALGGAVGLGLARNVRSIYAFLCRNYQKGDEIYAFGFSRGAFTIRILGGLIAARGIVDPGLDIKATVKKEWSAYRQKYGLLGRTKDAETIDHDVKIRFMGLWDTVDAYGFPIEEMRIAWDLFIWPLAMRDRELSSKVQDAYHALSIDDERQTFHPVLWTEKDQEPGSNIGEERITQVWFAGVHSNLGGGYPDDSLSHVSLAWMIAQAERCGLVFNEGHKTFALDEADEFGKIYNPRGGLSALYRYMPRQIADLSMEETRLGKDMAVEIKRPKIHESVFARLRNGTDSYAPFTLPKRYHVVRADGAIVPGVVPVINEMTPGAQETFDQADLRCQRQAQLWDMVWRRRAIYFVTLAFTLTIVVIPWTLAPAQVDWGGWTEVAAFLPGSLALFLPDFLSGWLDFYRVNPFLLLVLLAGGLTFGWLGARKEQKLRRVMLDMWKEWLSPEFTFTCDLPSGRLNTFMTRWGKLRIRRLIKYGLTPGIVGAIFYLAAFAGLSQLVSMGLDSVGLICRDGSASTSVPAAMRLTDPCYATRKTVAKDETYRVRISVAEPWFDKSVPASPEGLGEVDGVAWLAMKLAVPLRRHITEDWFAVMAKIEPDGLNSRALKFRRPAESDTDWEAEFTADADGELFLYVNDAVLFGWTGLYGNNQGGATVAIEAKPN